MASDNLNSPLQDPISPLNISSDSDIEIVPTLAGTNECKKDTVGKQKSTTTETDKDFEDDSFDSIFNEIIRGPDTKMSTPYKNQADVNFEKVVPERALLSNNNKVGSKEWKGIDNIEVIETLYNELSSSKSDQNLPSQDANVKQRCMPETLCNESSSSSIDHDLPSQGANVKQCCKPETTSTNVIHDAIKQLREIDRNKSFNQHRKSLMTKSKSMSSLKENVAFPKSLNFQSKCDMVPSKHNDDIYICFCGCSMRHTLYERNTHNINKHMDEQLKKNFCKICCVLFEDDKLIKHLKTTHFMKENKCPEKITCIICYKEYENEADLLQHMNKDHQNDILMKKASAGNGDGSSKYKCLLCSLFFKGHKVKAIHSIVFHKTPPFVCPCSKQFYSKGLFDFHVMQHTKAEAIALKIRKGFNPAKLW